MTLNQSLLALSLVAAGAEVADFLLVGPTALLLSRRGGYGVEKMGQIAGLISGLAALASAFLQGFLVDWLGPQGLVPLIIVLQVGAIFCMEKGRRLDLGIFEMVDINESSGRKKQEGGSKAL